MQLTFLIALALLLVNQLEVLLAQYECRAKILLAHDAVLCQFLWLALEEDASLEEQIARSVMVSVSCTLWSVIRMPMLRYFSRHTTC